MNGTWYVYVLLCDDASLYTGIAVNPVRRLQEHMRGRGAAYTHMHKPVRIVYTEQAATRADALKREHDIKQWSRTQKIQRLHLDLSP